jgi:hypothetical protein
MAFDHLIFDARKDCVQNAVHALEAFSCFQLKHAIDVDFLRNEYETIAALGRRFGSGLPPYQHMYRVLDAPDNPEFPLLKLVRSEPLYSILAGHFGSPDLITATHYASNLRLVKSIQVDEVLARNEPQSAEPYHQDSRCCPLKTFGPMIIVWVLLSPSKSGVDFAPTLKLVPGPVRELLPIEGNPIHPWNSDFEISHERIAQLSAETGAWIPDVEVGDAIVFTGMCPHGTFVPAEAKPTRVSAEIKLWSNSDLVHDKFFATSGNHPGHVVISKSFIVGPTEIEPSGENRVAQAVPHLSSGQCDYYKVAFSYGRIEDGGEYAVEDHRRPEPHRDPTKTAIAFLDIPGHSSHHFAQLLRPEHTGRSIVRGPRTLKSAAPPHDQIVIGPRVFGLHETTDDDVIYLAYLRDPTSRLLDHLFARPGKPSWAELERHFDSIATVSILPEYFAPRCRGSEQEALEVALRNIETFFPMVCIEERFAESAFLVFDMFGWLKIALPKTVPLPRNRPTKDDLPAHFRAKIETRLRADQQIYDLCLKRLEQRVSMTSFGPDLDRYRSDCTHLARILARTRATLAANALPPPEVQACERLASAQALEIQQLKEKVERMEGSYTALLKQHLEALKIPAE